MTNHPRLTQSFDRANEARNLLQIGDEAIVIKVHDQCIAVGMHPDAFGPVGEVEPVLVEITQDPTWPSADEIADMVADATREVWKRWVEACQ